MLTYCRGYSRALLGITLASLVTAPATAQQLFQYTEPVVDPELESWDVEVDLDLVRSGSRSLSIRPPSGESVTAELRSFEDRRNGNALWVGRVVGDSHDSLQFTLNGGYLVGTYSGTVGRQFGLRARPDGRGRVELRDLPSDESCGIDDERLAEILMRDREDDEGDFAGFELDSHNAPRGIAYAVGRFYVVDSDNLNVENRKVYAYDGSGNRAAAYDFDLDSRNWASGGITYVDGHFYVVDASILKVYGYDSSGNRASSYDFDRDSDNRAPGGITSANGRFYVVDGTDLKVYVYDSSGNRAPSYDFDLDSSNGDSTGIVYADGRFYVVDGTDLKVYAYDGSGNRASSSDFDLASNNNSAPEGITYAAGRFYVVDHDDYVYAYSVDSQQWHRGLKPGGTAATGELGAARAESNGRYELSVLPLVDPDAVYHWERTTGSSTEAEIIALYDYANMVFRNNGLSVRVVAPPGARDASGQPVPSWAPLTLLNEPYANRDPSVFRDPYPWPLYLHSAAVEGLRSRFGADLVELFYYRPNPQRYCGVADHIWLSDGTGTPRAARRVARLNGMSQTNVSCPATEGIFVHEVGHLLGAMHDGVRGKVLPCFQEGGRAYSCDAYGFFLNSTYPTSIDPALGTIMAYSQNWVPFFSTTRVSSPIVGGPIGGPRFANNEAVLGVTAPEASFFDQYLPSSPPVDVTVSSDATNIHFGWPTLPLVRGDLDIYYIRDPLFSEDLNKGAILYSLSKLYTGDPRTGVSAVRPGHVDPATGFFAFVVCLTYNGLEVCGEPVVQRGQTWTAVARPSNLNVTPSANVDNLVSLQWDDLADTEDGYKVQARAGSMPWQEPGLAVEPFGHLVRRNKSRAYLWGLDQVGTGQEDVLHFRVCAVRRWARDACSETVSLERREVGGPPAVEASLGLVPASVRVNEGDQANVTVRLSEAVQSDVTFGWSTAAESATGGTDYTTQSGTRTIAAGQTRADLTVPTLTDSVVEGDETFGVTIGARVRREASYDFNLDFDNGDPFGITYSAQGLRVVDVVDARVYGYDSSGNRVPQYDFNLHSDNVDPRGITYGRGRFYVVDWLDDKVYAYDVGGNRASQYDFNLDSNSDHPEGITYVDGRFYVVDAIQGKVYAHDGTGNRAAGYDFNLDSNNTDPRGIAYADGRFYVVDITDAKVYAYDGRGNRASQYDFDLDPNNDAVWGIVQAGERLLAIDWFDDKAYGYGSNLPSGVTLGTTAATVTIVDQTPLTSEAPTNLRVLGDRTSLGSVKLAWDDNSSSETGFVVEVTSSGHSFDVNHGANTTSATVSGLTVDRYYRFTVKAVTGQIESDPSNALYARSTQGPNLGEGTSCSHYQELARLGPGSEYTVRMCWQTPSGVETDALDFGLSAQDSGLLYFLERDNAEVLLKVLDFCWLNDYRWVFVAPVTTLAYRLSVHGPGGSRSSFYNPAGRTARSQIHKTAFPCSGSAAAPSQGGAGPVLAGPPLLPVSSFTPEAVSSLPFVDAELGAPDDPVGVSQATAPRCSLRSTGLTLAGGYRVSACWESGAGNSGGAVDWRLPSSQSGILYFFERDNAEVLIKVLDGCGVNGRRWVFVAPVTDLGLRLRVTAPNGASWDYENAVGTVASPRSDTTAFMCQ